MLTDPWGTRLELVPAPRPGVHHVHLRSESPRADAEWYQRLFGGKHGTMAGEATVAFGEVLLVITRGTAGASEGSAYDHIGWRTPQLEGTLDRLGAAKVRTLSDIEKRGASTRVIFIEGPSSVKIELLER